MEPHYLLDTNICIYIRQMKPVTVRERFARETPGNVGMSVITWGELLYGAAHSRTPAQARTKLKRVTTQIPVLPMPVDAAEHYGDIRASLAVAGNIIGANDLWIAAHARATGLVVVTNNVREFRRVKGLKVENWV